ncbi:MAG: Arginine/ornithine antiporter ArcD [Caulobacter sp.]|nr:Arginine/ornithine antiporter ArcD [Caulobacter sp.]
MTTETTSKPMLWTGRVFSGLFVLFILMDLTMKFIGRPEVAASMTQLGWPTHLSITLAVLLSVCLVLYLIPQTAILGAVLFTGYLGGAMATHLRVGSPLFSHVLFSIYVALFMWGGLWLRDARLRNLFPLRRA